MDKKTLKECIESLTNLKTQVTKSIQENDQNLEAVESNLNVGDDVDQATTNSEISRIKNLSYQLKTRSLQIQAAEKRIQSGSFGICIVCEEDIPKNRLKANPLAMRCLGCQEDQEDIDKENKLRKKASAFGQEDSPAESDD